MSLIVLKNNQSRVRIRIRSRACQSMQVWNLQLTASKAINCVMNDREQEVVSEPTLIGEHWDRSFVRWPSALIGEQLIRSEHQLARIHSSARSSSIVLERTKTTSISRRRRRQRKTRLYRARTETFFLDSGTASERASDVKFSKRRLRIVR